MLPPSPNYIFKLMAIKEKKVSSNTNHKKTDSFTTLSTFVVVIGLRLQLSREYITTTTTTKS